MEPKSIHPVYPCEFNISKIDRFKVEDDHKVYDKINNCYCNIVELEDSVIIEARNPDTNYICQMYGKPYIYKFY